MGRGDEPFSSAQRALMSALARSGVALCDRGLRESLRALRSATHTWNALLEADLYPAWESLLDVGAQVSAQLSEVAEGERRVESLTRELLERLYAGGRYTDLVSSFGRQLFGSATFAGEEVLAEERIFRLSFLPPRRAAGRGPFSLFHAGGTIPYGDRIFRLLPEYNFYDRFLERGVGVYTMELLGDRTQLAYGDLTLEDYIDSMARLSSVAYAHGGERPMALEGYCGSGSQSLAYLAARPDDAAGKFGLCALFVTPVDGRRCEALAEAIRTSPSVQLEAGAERWAAGDGYVPADYLRLGLDLNLRASFYKSPLGYFVAGWQRPDLNEVRRVEELAPRQRRDLAGAYWISPACARRFPVPIDIARYTARLFSAGVGNDGALPATYRGEPLSLARVREQTRLPLIGFYGGKDPVVPDATGQCLAEIFGPRYRHVVHPHAGHITYVMSPSAWDPVHKRGLRPNPLDLLLEQWTTPSAAPARRGGGKKRPPQKKTARARKKPGKKAPAVAAGAPDQLSAPGKKVGTRRRSAPRRRSAARR